jgi:predicted Fe-S protein YdhL (DUF1289 family)
MSNDQKLADAILAMVQLTPGERQTVMGVVERMRFTPTEVREQVEAMTQDFVATMVRIPYSQAAKIAFADAAYHWTKYTDAQRKAATKSLAIRFGRTEKAIRYQVTSRLK